MTVHFVSSTTHSGTALTTSSPTDVAGQIQLSKTPTQFAVMPVGGRVGCQWELFSRAGEELSFNFESINQQIMCNI